MEDLHRFAGLLAGSFLAVHGVSLLVDHYLPFSLTSLLVPGAAPYRPLPTALGVIAAELVAALAVTNPSRTRLPYGLWRRLHYLSFVVWLLALVHGVASGTRTDSTTPWGLFLYSVAAGSMPA